MDREKESCEILIVITLSGVQHQEKNHELCLLGNNASLLLIDQKPLLIIFVREIKNVYLVVAYSWEFKINLHNRASSNFI